ncbi:TIM barrel protein [Pseudomonas aeruginosa]|uniref:TIM barrel protein n=1 Tax=Pseudomonas aeruginosa TaxID=287 RepID=UPI00232F2BB6|nr:TIM barrel protein [Pseudomonas aeruginosa]
MSQTLRFALNRMVAPSLSLECFVELALSLRIDAVELRNDLPGAGIEHGRTATEVHALCAAYGIRVLSINALYPFDRWNAERRAQALALLAYARDCGAEGVVLCPLNDLEDRRDPPSRARDQRNALSALAPLLREHGLLGYIEPLGFEESALRQKGKALAAIREVGGLDVFRLLHDTFHHHLAGENELFPGLTGRVHISGVEDGALPLARIRDGHRVLVGSADLLGNARQLRELRAGGYSGYLSFEPFSGSVHLLPDIAAALGASVDHLQ